MSKKQNTSELEERNSFWDRLRRKSRVSFSNIETFEESRSFTASPMNFLVVFLFSLMIVIFATWCFIAFTPLKQSIPGFPDINEKRKIEKTNAENLKKIAEMESKLALLEKYQNPILSILNEEIPVDPSIGLPDSILAMDSSSVNAISFERSELDSNMRQRIAENQRFAVNFNNNQDKEVSDNISGVFFFTPLKGEISNKINPKEGHFGIDIKAPADDVVKSTLAGTVIFTDWSAENGNVIHVQHANNIVTVYKHNSELLKQQGDVVKAGEPIAIVGNSGSLSQGTHLHFELWYNGFALDPTRFINFE